jgi:hypothetical protein
MKWLGACLLGVLGVPSHAAAHVLDDYVQRAQIQLDTQALQIELKLIPGIQVAPGLLTLMDTDGDGVISLAEEQTYANGVLQDLALEVDGRDVALGLSRVQFPSSLEMAEGVGVINLTFGAPVELAAAGRHQVFFSNKHLPEISVYLANVLVPASKTVEIVEQRRDNLQRTLGVAIQIQPAPSSGSIRWLAVLLAILCLVPLL